MGHAEPFADLLLLLSAMVLMVPLFQRIGIGSVPGYLVGGLIVGPHGAGLISGVESVRTIAEFGVVFLLFVIGVELKPSQLWRMRQQVFGVGTAQVLISGSLMTAIAMGFGVAFAPAVLAGFALSLSSTAFVLQMLTERRELSSPHGRTAFSVLLLQDMAVVPLITLVYVFSSTTQMTPGQIAVVVAESAAIFFGILIAGRYLLNPVFNLLAGVRNREVFASAALLLVLGTGWLMEHANMSMAMGAFVAGLLLADSHFRHQIVADIQPFRGFLLGLFFVSVGMSLEISLVLEQWPTVVALLFGLIILKSGILFAVARFSGSGLRDAVRVAGLLAQGGEFAFVLFALAGSSGVMQAALIQPLLVVVVLSMLLTPLIAMLGDRLANSLPESGARHAAQADPEETEIMITGFGRVGRQVYNVLEAGGYRCVAVDRSHTHVDQGIRDGYNVFYGDASQPEILHSLGIDHAELVVLTMDDPQAAAETAGIIYSISPTIRVVARARDGDIGHTLVGHGVNRAIPETTEYSLQVGIAALETLGVDDAVLVEIEALMRADEYRALKQHETRVEEPAAAG